MKIIKSKKISTMETKEFIQPAQVAEKFQLVKGSFTPSEALHIIANLIDEKINYHRIQKLHTWEAKHTCNTEKFDARIEELEREKARFTEFIHEISGQGKNLKINGVLQISVVD